MFQNLIESLLGEWGPEAISFVNEHQLIISIVVVAFGVILIVRKRRKQAQDNANDEQKENKE